MGIRGSRSIGIGGLALAACLTFTPAASAQDDQGGTLRTAFEGDIAHFDPTVGYDISSSAVERLLYDTLIGYDEGTNLVPMLYALPDDPAAGDCRLGYLLLSPIHI